MWTKVKSVRIEMWDNVDVWDTLVINSSCRFCTTKLPTKVSDLDNDCCYLTEEKLSCAVCVKADKEYVDCCLDTKQNCWDYALNCTMTACLACKYDASNPCCYQTATEVAWAVSPKADKTYVDCCIEKLENDVEQLQWRGKFLSNWNANTGRPETEPEALPYVYHTWDYYMVTVVGSNNKRPSWSSYTWAASTTPETSELAEWDMYAYDGTNWLLQSNHGKTVSFANLSWVPSDNACLCSELASKQNNINDLDTIRSNACCWACAKTIISWYWDIVSHNASEFQAAWSYAQCCDLTTWLSWKVDKVNWINRIYWTDWSWCQTDYAYSDTTTANSIAKRDCCGNLCVADPTCNSHAATKWYVDTAVSWKTIYWWDVAWTLSCQTDLQTALNCKQNTISDLDAIRAWASAWASSVQPWDLCSVATSGKYCDLTWTPCATTWGTAIGVSNWEVSVCYDNSTIKVNNSDQIYADYTWLQRICNLVCNLSNPDDTHYPSAKTVADAIEWMSGWNMIKEVYDPCNCRKNIFDMDSMFDWNTNKVVTATEKELWSAKQEALTLPSSPTCWHLVVWWANKKTLVDWWEIPNSAQWWCITGTLCNQTDLQWVLDCKAQCCDIPTNNNQLTNGCGYTTCTWTVTSSDLCNYIHVWMNEWITTCIGIWDDAPDWDPFTYIRWGSVSFDWMAGSSCMWILNICWWNNCYTFNKCNNGIAQMCDLTNTKIFTVTGTTWADNLASAQAAYDWYVAWNIPLLYKNINDNTKWVYGFTGQNSSWWLTFTMLDYIDKTSWSNPSMIQELYIIIKPTDWVVTSMSNWTYKSCFLATGNNRAFTPTCQYDPTTKKYVDDKICLLSQSAYNALPSSKCTDWVYYVITDNECLWEYDDLVQSWMQCAVVELNKHPQKYYKKFLYECCLYGGPSWNLALYDECSWWQCCTLEVFQYCWYIND